MQHNVKRPRYAYSSHSHPSHNAFSAPPPQDRNMSPTHRRICSAQNRQLAPSSTSHASLKDKSLSIQKQLTHSDLNFAQLFTYCEENLPDFDPINTATAICKWVKLLQKTSKRPRSYLLLDEAQKQQLMHLTEKFTTQLPSCTPFDISNVAKACAKLKFASPQLFATIEAQTIYKIREFNPKDIETIQIAFSELNLSQLALAKAIQQSAHEAIQLQLLEATSLSDLSHCLDRYASHFTSKHLCMLASRLEKILPLKEQDIKILARQKLLQRHEASALYHNYAKDIIKQLVGKLPLIDADPRALANIAHAAAHMEEIIDPQELIELFAVLAHLGQKKLCEFNARDLTTMASAFASAGIYIEFLNVLTRQAQSKIGECDLIGLSNLAWALASLALPAPQLFCALIAEAAQRHEQFWSDGQAITNIAWACAIQLIINDFTGLDPAVPFLSQLLPQLLAHLRTPISPQGLTQLGQVALFCQQHQIACVYPEKLAREVATAAEQQRQNPPKSSKLHEDVVKFTTTIDADYATEVYAGGGYFLDIAYHPISTHTSSTAKRAAIEVNGPHHYIKGTERVFGAEILRTHLLEAAGWVIFPLSYRAWEEAQERTKMQLYDFINQHVRAHKDYGTNALDQLPTEFACQILAHPGTEQAGSACKFLQKCDLLLHQRAFDRYRHSAEQEQDFGLQVLIAKAIKALQAADSPFIPKQINGKVSRLLLQASSAAAWQERPSLHPSQIIERLNQFINSSRLGYICDQIAAKGSPLPENINYFASAAQLTAALAPWVLQQPSDAIQAIAMRAIKLSNFRVISLLYRHNICQLIPPPFVVTAAEVGNETALKFFHSQKASLELSAPNEQNMEITPLMAAAKAGHLDIVKYLLEAGVQVNHSPTEGHSPLIYAVQAKHEEVVRLLIQYGAEVTSAAFYRREQGSVKRVYMTLGMCHLLLSGYADLHYGGSGDLSHDIDEEQVLGHIIANKGLLVARRLLAFKYEHGIGVTKSLPVAMHIYQSLLDKSDAKQLLFLQAKQLEHGWQTAPDAPQAFKCYQMAADLGCSEGLAHLGRCYEQGVGTAVDKEKALQAYRLAAEMDDPLACNALGVHYAKTESALAQQYFERAIDRHYYLPAVYNFAKLQDKTTCYYRASADLGLLTAIYRLAELSRIPSDALYYYKLGALLSCQNLNQNLSLLP